MACSIIGKKLVVSKTDMELLLADVDGLYFRIWKAHRLASKKKKGFAGEIGVTEEKINKLVKDQIAQAQIEDENTRRLLGEKF
jgi:hypothetical protein